MDWILICQLCKFCKYVCYNVRDIKFFLGGYFFWRALYSARKCNAQQNWPHLLTYLIAYRDSRNCRLQSIFLIILYTTTGISSRAPSFQLFPRWLKVHNIPSVHLQFSPFKLHVSATLWRRVRHMVAAPPNVAALTWRRRDPERILILRTQVTLLYIRAREQS